MKLLHGYQIYSFCGGRIEYAGISTGHIFPDINAGQMYVCRECGYQGSFIVEVKEKEDARKMKEYLKKQTEENIAPPFSLLKNYVWLWRAMLLLTIIGIAIAIIQF